MRSLFCAGLLTAALVLGACSEAQAPPASETLIDTPQDDPAMDAAMKQAVDTQGIFWAKFEKKEPGTSEYAVKLAITGQDGYREFIWAEPIRRTNREVVAKLLNVPVHLQGLELGSEVRADRNLVFDWSYEKGGRAYGQYTTRVLLDRMSPAQRAEAEAMLAPTPLEATAP
jgi:uncharacterized protein YegJ (DUF2314 family)